jgi:AcrR family transcriptional regulator
MPKAATRPDRSATRPAPPPRRTQAERRTTTRRGLLDAAIECLVDAGYSGLTTTEVCRRAGVSQGALFKHFATKAELVAATAEHLFANLVDTFRAGLPPLDARTDRAAVVVQQLWTVFQQPRLEAAFELYVAARTDAELARRLAPVSVQHSENMRRLAHELFPEAAHDARFDAFVDLGISALQGAAIGRPLRRDDAVHAPMLAVLTTFLRQIVESRLETRATLVPRSEPQASGEVIKP